MLKAEISSKTVTPAQLKFLHLLHDRGPLSANELAGEMGKSRQYAHAIIREMREKGIIEKTLEGIDTSEERILSWRYKLAVSINSITISTRRTPSSRIPDEEILYAAILRNSGMTGRELQDQFRSKYPHRSVGSLLGNIIPRARQRKWCR